jgi:hypothetical protein
MSQVDEWVRIIRKLSSTCLICLQQQKFGSPPPWGNVRRVSRDHWGSCAKCQYTRTPILLSKFHFRFETWAHVTVTWAMNKRPWAVAVQDCSEPEQPWAALSSDWILPWAPRGAQILGLWGCWVPISGPCHPRILALQSVSAKVAADATLCLLPRAHPLPSRCFFLWLVYEKWVRVRLRNFLHWCHTLNLN